MVTSQDRACRFIKWPLFRTYWESLYLASHQILYTAPLGLCKYQIQFRVRNVESEKPGLRQENKKIRKENSYFLIKDVRTHTGCSSTQCLAMVGYVSLSTVLFEDVYGYSVHARM